MTLMHLGFGLMTVAAVALYVGNHRLIKALRESKKCLESATYLIDALSGSATDHNISLMHKAEVEERLEPIPHFAVYRKGLTKKHDVVCVGYDPNDPGDRDYKRIHAEEVAEKLNEKP